MAFPVRSKFKGAGLQSVGCFCARRTALPTPWPGGPSCERTPFREQPALAADLVQRKVAIIITQGTPAAFAAKRATSKIPIVMAIAGNPVDTGIVPSLARPGGNITGSSFFWAEVNAKRLELMKELKPSLARAGVLLNPDNPAVVSLMRAMTQTANARKFSLQPVHARRRDEIRTAIESIGSQIDALVIIDDGLFVANAKHIAEIATTNKLPSVGFREYCEAGGLAAYAVDFPHIWRGAGAFVEKIFNGRKPAELPIQQATRFEFVINLRTAKSIGFEVSSLMSARANQVIE